MPPTQKEIFFPEGKDRCLEQQTPNMKRPPLALLPPLAAAGAKTTKAAFVFLNPLTV